MNNILYRYKINNINTQSIIEVRILINFPIIVFTHIHVTSKQIATSEVCVCYRDHMCTL